MIADVFVLNKTKLNEVDSGENTRRKCVSIQCGSVGEGFKRELHAVCNVDKGHDRTRAKA